MDLEHSPEWDGNLGKTGKKLGRVRVFLVFFLEAKLFVDQGDDGVFTQVVVAVEVPLGTDFFTDVPAQGHVGAEDRQPGAGAIDGRAGVVQEFPEVGLLAQRLRVAPFLLVFSGQADGGGRRRLFPRPPAGGQVHHGLSHSVSMRLRKSSRTRCTVRSLMPSRSPMSLLDSPSAFISRIERFSSGTSSRRRPKTSCA